jgi:hypothetical protein
MGSRSSETSNVGICELANATVWFSKLSEIGHSRTGPGNNPFTASLNIRLTSTPSRASQKIIKRIADINGRQTKKVTDGRS